MKLIFFDEAKNDEGYEHYHIGGVGIDEKYLDLVESRINKVVEKSGPTRRSKGAQLGVNGRFWIHHCHTLNNLNVAKWP